MPYLLFQSLPDEATLASRYPADQTASVVREKHRNALAMEQYLAKIKEYAKDDRNIWLVMKEEQERARARYAREDARRQSVAKEQKAARVAEMKREIQNAQ